MQKIAATYGIDPRSIYNYENFDRLADNAEVDSVYIVLPNSMHAEYSIRGLKAGKHVLCEKPMAVSIEECELMIATARESGKKLGIAYRLHHEPLNLAVMDLCRKKAYGEIKAFTSSNCQNVTAPNIRLSAALGGGPIRDVGVYSINAARNITGEEPVEVMATSFSSPDDPRFREVPETVSYTLRFPSGILATCDCSFGSAHSQRYRVLCRRGYIEMDPSFPYQGLNLKVCEEPEGQAPRITDIKIAPVNQFTEEFDHFSASILQNTKFPTPGEEGLADMRVVTALNESLKTRRPIGIAINERKT